MQGVVKGGNNDGGGLKSVQYVYVNFNSGAIKDVTISPVNTDLTIVRLKTFNQLYTSFGAVTPELIDGTTVRLTRWTADTRNLYITVIVEQYYSAKSKQTGSYTFSASGTEADVTITSVNAAKTITVANFRGSFASYNYCAFDGNARLKDSTTLGLTGYNTGICVYQILET